MPGSFFVELLTLLTAAALVLGLFQRLRWPPTLAYLLVGAIIGPGGLALIGQEDSLSHLAEFGVVFLLFSLGLEFSLARVVAMRRQVFLLGGAQMALCTGAFGAVALACGLEPKAALVVAATLALSSTAVVMRELARRKELDARHGQLGVAVLLFQDLAAVGLLILIPALAGDADALPQTLLLTSAKGVALLLLLLGIGRWVLPRLFFEVAKSHSEELFVLTALVITLLAAAVTAGFGLSMALGAFIAGMMLGESRYRYQIEAEIRPFRDVLLGVFFVSIGMLIDWAALAHIWPLVLVLTAGLLTFKTLLIAVLGMALREDRETSVRAALVLAQGGEFGFAMLTLAAGHGLLPPQVVSVVLATIITSMAATPIVVRHNQALAQILLRGRGRAVGGQPASAALGPTVPTDPISGEVLICGFGRVGQTIARVLRREGVTYVAADPDPVRVREALLAGEPIRFGDTKHAALLRHLGIERARLVVVSFSNAREALAIVTTVRRLRADVPVLVRTADDHNLDALKSAGATAVIPETLEAALTLVSHVLALLDFPLERVQQSVQGVREDRYRVLHGYFHGARSRVADAAGQALEVLHAVALPPGAWAVGRRLMELDLERIGASVRSVRRSGGDEDLPAAPDLTLAAQDVVLLQGSAHQVEAAEARLLGG